MAVINWRLSTHQIHTVARLDAWHCYYRLRYFFSTQNVVERHICACRERRFVMLDENLFNLCRQIGKEPNSKKLSELVEKLIETLSAEQEAIKAKVDNSLSKRTGGDV
jgi:hypothetical protein